MTPLPTRDDVFLLERNQTPTMTKRELSLGNGPLTRRSTHGRSSPKLDPPSWAPARRKREGWYSTTRQTSKMLSSHSSPLPESLDSQNQNGATYSRDDVSTSTLFSQECSQRTVNSKWWNISGSWKSASGQASPRKRYDPQATGFQPGVERPRPSPMFSPIGRMSSRPTPNTSSANFQPLYQLSTPISSKWTRPFAGLLGNRTTSNSQMSVLLQPLNPVSCSQMGPVSHAKVLQASGLGTIIAHPKSASITTTACADGRFAVTNMSVNCVGEGTPSPNVEERKKGTLNEVVLNAKEELTRRGERPRFLRDFLWADDDDCVGPTARYSLAAEPMPGPPVELFKIVIPINTDALEQLLKKHPNRPFVNSVLRSLRLGFWPWADGNLDGYPETWDNSHRPLIRMRARVHTGASPDRGIERSLPTHPH
jgi:hypothetical protein